MSRPQPQLDRGFIHVVGAADDGKSMRGACERLNRIAATFHETFATEPHRAPSWSQLEAGGEMLATHVALDLATLHDLVGRRLADLVSDFVDCLNRRRLLAATLSARALLESCAFAVYIDDRLREHLNSYSGLPVASAFLHRMIAGGRFDWVRARQPGGDVAMLAAYAKARSAKDAPLPPEDRLAINVTTMVDRLDARAAESARAVDVHGGEGFVRAVYAILSDFCHPAAGNTLLYASSGPTGETVLDSQAGDELVRYLFRSALVALPPLCEIARDALISIQEQFKSLRTCDPR